MPKRFSETSKWEDPWFMSLTGGCKLVFLFMVDKCDNAGFFEPNELLHPLMIGITKEQYLAAIEGLSRGYLGATEKSGSKKVWLVNFLRHQKNLPLNPENNAHKNIIGLINDHQKEFDLSVIAEKLGANKGLFSPIGKVRSSKVLDSDTNNAREDLTKEIIDHLNLKTKSKYKYGSKETVGHINARMNDGYSVEDFKKVIDVKAAEWLGTDHHAFLRPATLFAPSHFEDYLQQAIRNTHTPPPPKEANQKERYEKIIATIGAETSKEDIAFAYDYQRKTGDKDMYGENWIMERNYPLTLGVHHKEKYANIPAHMR